MKLKDLREALKDYSPEMDIIFSGDEEGNSYMRKCMVSRENKKLVILFPYDYMTSEEVDVAYDNR